MTLDRASVRTTLKPWGRLDLGPWASENHQDSPVGEISFAYDEAGERDRLLLLKLLFTRETLSIQVHPDDAAARSMGMESGKSEAWYVLAAEDGAQVAVGLKREQNQGAPSNLISIMRGKIRRFAAFRIICVEQTVPSVGPGHLG